MSQKNQEWLRQAYYDMESANVMFQGGRYFYAVFMCHLSIEKGLKGIFQQKTGELPPKTHNLLYFVDKLKLIPPTHVSDFITILNRVSVTTRYPDDLDELLKEFPKNKVQDLLNLGKEALDWIKESSLKS